MQLGPYIKSRRNNLGMTQKQLAKKVGVTDVTISRYENGKREPSFTECIALTRLDNVYKSLYNVYNSLYFVNCIVCLK